LWEAWEKISQEFSPLKKYLIVKRNVTDSRLLEHSKKIHQVYFVNIEQTAVTLEENYSVFRNLVGFDFDPLEVTLEFQSKESRFWNAIESLKQSDVALLWGLLFGYGKENAIHYQWKSKALTNTISTPAKVFINSFTHFPSNKKFIQETERNAFTIAKFPIPYFASFSKNDPMVARYEEERKQIQRVYYGRDFVDKTIELLTR